MNEHIESLIRQALDEARAAYKSRLFEQFLDKAVGGADGEMVVRWTDIKQILKEDGDGAEKR